MDTTDFYESFIKTLLTMEKRCADRDNTIMLSMRYENFGEFHERIEPYMFMIRFSCVKKFYAGLVRNYTLSQMHILDGVRSDDEGYQRVYKVIDEAIQDNIDDIIKSFAKHHPTIFKKIEAEYPVVKNEVAA